MIRSRRRLPRYAVRFPLLRSIVTIARVLDHNQLRAGDDVPLPWAGGGGPADDAGPASTAAVGRWRPVAAGQRTTRNLPRPLPWAGGITFTLANHVHPCLPRPQMMGALRPKHAGRPNCVPLAQRGRNRLPTILGRPELLAPRSAESVNSEVRR